MKRSYQFSMTCGTCHKDWEEKGGANLEVSDEEILEERHAVYDCDQCQKPQCNECKLWYCRTCLSHDIDNTPILCKNCCATDIRITCSTHNWMVCEIHAHSLCHQCELVPPDDNGE